MLSMRKKMILHINITRPEKEKPSFQFLVFTNLLKTKKDFSYKRAKKSNKSLEKEYQKGTL